MFASGGEHGAVVYAWLWRLRQTKRKLPVPLFVRVELPAVSTVIGDQRINNLD